MQAGMGTAVVAFVRMKGKEPIVMMPTKVRVVIMTKMVVEEAVELMTVNHDDGDAACTHPGHADDDVAVVDDHGMMDWPPMPLACWYTRFLPGFRL